MIVSVSMPDTTQMKWDKESVFFCTQTVRNVADVKYKTAFESPAFWFLTTPPL